MIDIIDIKNIEDEFTKILQNNRHRNPDKQLLDDIIEECTAIMCDNGFNCRQNQDYNPVIPGVNLIVTIVNQKPILMFVPTPDAIPVKVEL